MIRSSLFIFLFFVTSCSYQERSLVSPDGRYTLTIFEKADNTGKSYTYIAQGKVSAKETPNRYVRVRNRFSDAWYCLIEWKGNGVIIYQPYSNFEAYNLNEEMELRKMGDRKFSKIFYSKEKDEYIRLSSLDR
ncbi:MAG: hypothetical protein AAF573_11235 [Bacteroidota bacterium]